MSEQEKAKAEMDRLGWKYQDFGVGFHVVKFGVFKMPAEILNYIDHWKL